MHLGYAGDLSDTIEDEGRTKNAAEGGKRVLLFSQFRSRPPLILCVTLYMHCPTRVVTGPSGA